MKIIYNKNAIKIKIFSIQKNMKPRYLETALVNDLFGEAITKGINKKFRGGEYSISFS